MRGSGISQRSARSRLNVKMVVARAQVIEKQVIDALGLRIQPNSRIQISGAAFDNHHQRIGIGLPEQASTGTKSEESSARKTRGHSRATAVHSPQSGERLSLTA